MNPANALPQLSPGMAECHARLMVVAKHGTPEAFSATLAAVLQRAELSISNAYDAGAKSIQIEAIGACGVSGPLVGQPQAVPDLSQLTERGAVAWAGVDAQGLRDGGASLSADAGEPFGWVKQSEIDSSKQFGGSINLWRQRYDCDVPVYLAAPPTAQAEGWRPIETAPKDGALIVLGARNGVWLGKYVPVYQSGYRPENPWSSMLLNHDHMAERYTRPTHWMPLPPPPTSAEGVEHADQA